MTIDYPKIIGTGFFIFIIGFLLFRLYLAIRKVKGMMPLVDSILLKLYGKNIREELKNGFSKKDSSTTTRSKDGENPKGAGGNTKKTEGTNRSGNESEEDGTNNINKDNRRKTSDSGGLDNSIERSRGGEFGKVKSIRKYKSIFE